MSTTKRADYTFTVKEFADGTPFIMFEPQGKDLDVISNGNLHFDLPKGTTYEQASKIAKFMRDNLAELAYTE